MNQFMVNDFVITSKSLLINDEIVSTTAMRAHYQHRKPTMGVDVSRNNQVWNEELVLTNIMRNNHRLSAKVGRAGESGGLIVLVDIKNKRLIHKTKVMCRRTRL